MKPIQYILFRSFPAGDLASCRSAGEESPDKQAPRSLFRDRLLSGAWCRLLVVGMFLMGGCTQNEEPVAGQDTRIPVGFSVSTGNVALPASTTRTQNLGENWSLMDRVGIFMKYAGTTLGDASVVGGAANKQYWVYVDRDMEKGKGQLRPVENETIYYPLPKTAEVDFVAYYPYLRNLRNGYEYYIEIHNQDTPLKQAGLDILYSNNEKERSLEKNASQGNDSVRLQFTHALSKLKIHASAGRGMTGADFSDMNAVITYIPRSGVFSFVDQRWSISADIGSVGMLKWETPQPTYDATYEALLVPHPGRMVNPRAMEFQTDGGEVFVCNLADDFAFEPGKIHTWYITINRSGSGRLKQADGFAASGPAEVEVMHCITSDWDDDSFPGRPALRH